MPSWPIAFITFLFSSHLALAQQSSPVDQTVEEDIFFGTLPEEGMEFIEELPENADSADQIYNPKTRGRRSTLDVRDRGPIELKQAPKDQSPQKVQTPDFLKEDPLFSVEKEEPVSRPKADASSVEGGAAESYKAPSEGFEFPENPDASTGGVGVPGGVPGGPRGARPQTSPSQPGLGRPNQTDQFGRPIAPPPTQNQRAEPEGLPNDQEGEFWDEPESDPEVTPDNRRRQITRPSSPPAPTSPGTPASPGIYDDVEVIWSQRGSSEIKIKHPAAEKGLIRITQDRTYIYRVPRSEQTRAFSFRMGIMNPEDLANPDTGATFADSYDSTEAPVAFFEYEWQWFSGVLGKLGLKIGSGIFVSEGNGNFRNNYAENGSKTDPLEKFTFVALPNSLGAVYRMQFFDRQILVPYADGGVMGITFAEFRDDEDAPKIGLGYAGFFSLGGALNLGLLDSLSLLELDREYGINGLYLTGEFRQIVNMGSDYDFTSSTINAGILAEF